MVPTISKTTTRMPTTIRIALLLFLGDNGTGGGSGALGGDVGGGGDAIAGCWVGGTGDAGTEERVAKGGRTEERGTTSSSRRWNLEPIRVDVTTYLYSGLSGFGDTPSITTCSSLAKTTWPLMVTKSLMVTLVPG
jgi:hypothetical protein